MLGLKLDVYIVFRAQLSLDEPRSSAQEPRWPTVTPLDNAELSSRHNLGEVMKQVPLATSAQETTTFFF